MCLFAFLKRKAWNFCKIRKYSFQNAKAFTNGRRVQMEKCLLRLSLFCNFFPQTQSWITQQKGEDVMSPLGYFPQFQSSVILSRIKPVYSYPFPKFSQHTGCTRTRKSHVNSNMAHPSYFQQNSGKVLEMFPTHSTDQCFQAVATEHASNHSVYVEEWKKHQGISAVSIQVTKRWLLYKPLGSSNGINICK